jgi:hypothetical protein
VANQRDKKVAGGEKIEAKERKEEEGRSTSGLERGK